MLKRLSSFIVEKRIAVLTIMLVLAVVCAVCSFFVNINEDLTKYLPDDSPMKTGIDLMNEAFPQMESSNSIRVMFDGLSAAEKAEVLQRLSAIKNVVSVDHDPDSAEYNKDEHTLYILHISCTYRSAEERAIEKALETDFSDYSPVWHNDDTSTPQIPPIVLLVVAILLLAILLTMCGSWLEPFLFLFTIGIAVLLNLGTNLFLGTVSSITKSIAAILQLGLSMDYSIILTNRYRQERASEPDKVQAMKNAWANAFSSVSASALTTVAGLLMLVFMSFKIGTDLGVVLAKGVFLSMVCVLTILPALIILFDRLLLKTAKKELHVPTDWAASFSFRQRRVLTALFVVLFVGFYFLQAQTGIDYTLAKDDPVAEVFPMRNMVVVVYENRDEAQIEELMETLEADENVSSVMNYDTLMAKPYTSAELASMLASFGDGLPINPMLLELIYAQYCPDGKNGRMTIEELYSIVNDQILTDPRYAPLLTPEIKEKLGNGQAELEAGRALFVSDRYSRFMITTTYPEESEATTAFLDAIYRYIDAHMEGETYLIGNSIMAYEMQGSFDGELLSITLLTALAIFLIVALTFRSVFVPLLLVLLVQCGVYITVTVTGIMSGGMYYLALLMVECILMGATIDYGILFTNYYREHRRSVGVAEALKQAYTGSVHTILTSGLILVLITAAVGRLFEDKAVTEIVRTISIGSFCVILLILFILPGILAACDRLVVKKK